MDIKSRLDLTQVFCDVDDFYKAFQQHCETLPLLTSSVGEKYRSIWNFFVNLFGGLIAYTYLPQKPSLDLKPKGLSALPPALF